MIKEQLENGKWKYSCEKCRYVRITARENYEPVCSCLRVHHVIKEHLLIERDAKYDRRAELPEPSLLRKGQNFTRASIEHARSGFQLATDEQVEERFAICQACPIFKPIKDGEGVCTHTSCGCSLKRVGVKGKNKLRWAEQVCPYTEDENGAPSVKGGRPAPRWGKIDPPTPLGAENGPKTDPPPENEPPE